jgi:hypothetical protein
MRLLPKQWYIANVVQQPSTTMCFSLCYLKFLFFYLAHNLHAHSLVLSLHSALVFLFAMNLCIVAANKSAFVESQMLQLPSLQACNSWHCTMSMSLLEELGIEPQPL